jgi:hypothetical protein
MKHFFALRINIAALLALLMWASACQKEVISNTGQNATPPTQVSDRAAVFYGVTNYDGFGPCKVIGIENATGNIVSNVSAYYIGLLGNIIPLDNLKGITMTSWGQYFVTSGDPVNPGSGGSTYSNALFKINPLTGQCSYLSYHPGGALTDLEFDPATQNFYGVLENTNSIIEISNANNNNYGDYSTPADIVGIADGYFLRGLSLVQDANGLYFIGCASNSVTGDPAKLYTVPVTGGTATFMTDLDQLGGWVNGNCGIGYDLEYNRVNINRDWLIAFPGLNYFKWNPPFGPNEVTYWWGGGDGFDYEDLTSSAY